MYLSYLPGPARGVWHLGPVPIRAYALCILAGIVVAVWLTRRRWVARGGAGADAVGRSSRLGAVCGSSRSDQEALDPTPFS